MLMQMISLPFYGMPYFTEAIEVQFSFLQNKQIPSKSIELYFPPMVRMQNFYFKSLKRNKTRYCFEKKDATTS